VRIAHGVETACDSPASAGRWTAPLHRGHFVADATGAGGSPSSASTWKRFWHIGQVVVNNRNMAFSSSEPERQRPVAGPLV
jgi:hypothetical protein